MRQPFSFSEPTTTTVRTEASIGTATMKGLHWYGESTATNEISSVPSLILRAESDNESTDDGFLLRPRPRRSGGPGILERSPGRLIGRGQASFATTEESVERETHSGDLAQVLAAEWRMTRGVR